MCFMSHLHTPRWMRWSSAQSMCHVTAAKCVTDYHAVAPHLATGCELVFSLSSSSLTGNHSGPKGWVWGVWWWWDQEEEYQWRRGPQSACWHRWIIASPTPRLEDKRLSSVSGSLGSAPSVRLTVMHQLKWQTFWWTIFLAMHIFLYLYHAFCVKVVTACPILSCCF